MIAIQIYALVLITPGVSAYTSHSVIDIQGNSGFVVGTHGVVSGSGTVLDPFIIEGWEIATYSQTFGIYINNTNVYFTIRNVYIHDSPGKIGIRFFGVTNGRIEDTTITGTDYGLDIWGSSYVDIVNCNISSNNGYSFVGGSGYPSSHVKLIGNRICNNGGFGIGGIWMQYASDVTIESNTISANGNGGGIWFDFISSTTIKNNNITLHEDAGIYLGSTNSGILIYGNRIEGNKGRGVYIGGVSSGNTIYRNYFFFNTPRQAEESASLSVNAWDNGYPAGGNYWSDYSGVDVKNDVNQDLPGSDGIGDTPYVLNPFSGEPAKDNYPLVIDWPPVASFTVSPPSGNISTTFAVNASSSSDIEDPVSSLEVRWDWQDNGTWTSWTTTKSAVHQYPAPGNYTIRLEVIDLKGLTNQTTKKVTVVDVPPVASFTISPLIGNLTTIFNVDASASYDLEEPSSSLQVRWDWEGDGTWDTSWLPLATTTHSFASDGIYTIVLEVMDIGGLTDTATQSVLVESIPPTTTTGLAGTPGSAGWYISNVTATLTATDNVGGSGVNYTKYRIDGGSWLTYTAPFSISADGTHTVEFYSVDLAGNTEGTKSSPVKIDKTLPTLTFNQSSGITISKNYIVINWIGSDAESGIDYFEVSLDGGAFTSVGMNMSHNFTGLADGSHNVIVKAIDSAGNEANQTIQFTIDTSVSGGSGVGISGDLMFYGGIAAIIILAIIAAIVIMMRKKRSPPKSLEGMQMEETAAEDIPDASLSRSYDQNKESLSSAQKEEKRTSGSTIRCSYCGADNSGELLFCGHCGKPIALTQLSASQPQMKSQNRCPKCGADNPAGLKYCGKCGESIL